jgi:YD repeat-containing protein
MKRTLLMLVFVVLAFAGCNDDEITGTATLNGSQFVATEITVTDTGAGLLIELTRGQEIIRIWTSQKKSGTFPVVNTTASSPVEFQGNPSVGFAVAQFINASGIVFFGETGSVTVSLGSSTKGSFSFDAETADRSEVEIRSGSYSAPLSSPMISGCAIESITYPTPPLSTINYGYGHHGNLTSALTKEGTNFTFHFFSWQNDVLKSVLYGNYSTTNNFISSNQVSVTSTGNRISSFVEFDFPTTYTYDNTGRLIQVQYGNGEPLTIDYDATGNVVRQGNVVFSNFDNQNNPATLHLNALTNQQAILWYFARTLAAFPLSGGVNNPQQMGDFSYTYTYNSRNFPLTRTDSGPGNRIVEYTYRNCR